MRDQMRPGRVLRACLGIAALGVAMELAGCAAMYVDGNLPETPKAEFRMPAQPPAVQLVFEFQTKGAPNQRATDLLKSQVKSQVQESGLFSSVSDGGASGAALLSFTLNNIPLTGDAAAKGFVTGLTFGLAGTTVADGYEATLRYTPPTAGSAPLMHEAKHIIHTSLGTGSPPPGAIKTSGGEEAARLMTKQVLSRVLGALSKDPAFPVGKAGITSAEATKQP